jgi:hypothetical protein
MSLLPFDFHFSRPASLFDQTFGDVLDEFYSDVPSVFRPGYCRPWRYNSASDSGVSKVVNDMDKYEVRAKNLFSIIATLMKKKLQKGSPGCEAI